MFIIVTTSAFDCPWCIKAKELLNEYEIEYQEYDIQTDKHFQEVFKTHGLKTVPQIWNEFGLQIGGYENLVKYLEEEFNG